MGRMIEYKYHVHHVINRREGVSKNPTSKLNMNMVNGKWGMGEWGNEGE